MSEKLPIEKLYELAKQRRGKKRHKYGAKWTIADGIKFQSEKEARRYKELQMLLAAGKISNLRRQRPFKLNITVRYFADFVYEENGREVVEDAKGFRTEEYKRKKRLMKKQHGIDIREV